MLKKLSALVFAAAFSLALPALAGDAAKAGHEGQAKEDHAKHAHKKDCGHKAEKHGDHTDYEDEGHHHKKHGDHFDECSGPEAEAKPATH